MIPKSYTMLTVPKLGLKAHFSLANNSCLVSLDVDALHLAFQNLIEKTCQNGDPKKKKKALTKRPFF